MPKNNNFFSKKTTRLLLLTTTVITTVTAIPTSHAHHGFAVHYDINKSVSIEGVLQSVALRNPHSEITIHTTNDAGKDVIWHCETQAKSLLNRKGITKESLGLGKTVIVEGSAARRKTNYCEVGTLHTSTGESFVFRSAAGRANIKVNTQIKTTKRQSVFGKWIRDSFNGAPMDVATLNNINEAGKKLNLQYEAARDDPTNLCSPVNPMRAWITPGSPTEIRHESEYVIIQHEFMDTTRKIKLIDPKANSNKITTNTAGSIMGTSVGYITDTGTLVVETYQFSAGVFITQLKNSGVLHSSDLTMREEFSLDAESGRLRYRWQARDPQYFPEAITGQLLLSSTELDIGIYDCQSR